MDRWTACAKGHVHWGALGGAGLLFRHEPEGGAATYLLTQRSRWVDYGGTFGIPGGAMREGETVEAAARREAEEEIGRLPPYRITGIDEQDCGGGWVFRIVKADVDEQFVAYSMEETDATGWFTLAEMRTLHLHPGFARWLEPEH
jgi:8-oxo-dGTP diphosphatase